MFSKVTSLQQLKGRLWKDPNYLRYSAELMATAEGGVEYFAKLQTELMSK
jgi:hypothetical protein